MNLPSIAVVIPFFNDSNTIGRALESVRAQELQPSEIVIVDDASNEFELHFLDNLLQDYLDLPIKLALPFLECVDPVL